MTERTGSDWPVDGMETIVIAQADTTPEATGQPRVLVEEPAEETEELAATEATPVDPETLGIAPVDAGERRVIVVTPGTTVELDDPAFDPSRAVYAVDGLDLVVTQANGGVLVLVGFFAPSEAPPQLSVLGAPATSAPVLLQQAEAAPVLDEQSNVEPAAGPQDGPQGGGGAGFTAYDAGSIGDGLNPLGPLGPTSLTYSAPDPEIENTFVGDDDNNNGNNPPPPPDPTGPTVSVQSTVTAVVGEVSGPGYNPVTTPILPVRGPGISLPDNEVNGVDQRNLNLDLDREVYVRFADENSVSIDSLFVHEIAADGTITNVRLVFDGANKPGDVLGDLNETPLGTEFKLGTYAAGVELGFVVVNDGLRLNDFSSLEGGHYEFRNVYTGEPSTIYDFHQPNEPWRQPRLFHIADDGTETRILGDRLFSADASQHTPNSNRLNPDLKGHYVSGWDDEQGELQLGVEDDSHADSDRDFADLVFGVRFSSSLNSVLVIEAFKNGVDAVITDADSAEMASATIELTGFAGDTLLLDPIVATGTGITVTQVSDTLIELEGLASIEAYQQVINAATIAIDLENPQFGERQIAVGVTDPDGLTGTGTTTIDVENNLITGPGDGNGNDTLIGTAPGDGQSGDDVISGRGGDDTIYGMGGNDYVDGGNGYDMIDVSQPGENTVIGGPQPDKIILGPGADLVKITGLADGADTISFFDATEGDLLDLQELFRDSDITADNIADYVQTSASADGIKVQVDLDGRGSEARFVDIAHLQDSTGIVAGGDPSSFVIIPGAEPPVT